MATSLDPIRMIPIVRCEDCPFGVIKKALSKSPVLVCRHPMLEIDRVISNQAHVGSNIPTKPPEWCNLTSFSELIMKNRHEVIKIIEDAYGPLRIDPWDRIRKPEKGDKWEKTYMKRYWQLRMRDSQNIPKYNQKGKEDPSYPLWLKKLRGSFPKTKKSG